MAEPVNALFEDLEKKIKETRKMVSDIKKKWFFALDKQQETESLKDRIRLKLEKITDV